MRLEQRDSYLRRFTARVRAVEADGRGTRVALDASAFYPTSGGQPHDTGHLDGVAVVDVNTHDGVVWHWLDGHAPELGSVVAGAIDWDRRYRHMQRHSAQHLLSQAFVRVSPTFDTHSVSLRSADCTIDVSGDPEDAALLEVETLANDFGFAALPIFSFEVEEADLAAYPLRRAPKVRGRIRLVAMGDVELAACGGTHLASTAEALPIKLLGSERVRGGLRRVTFRAGWEALEDHRAKHALASDLIKRLSTPLGELPARVARLQEELSAAHAALVSERRRRAGDLADSLLADAPRRAGLRVVRAEVEDALLEPLVDLLGQTDGVLALLGAAAEGRVRLAFARNAGSGPDLRPVLGVALEAVGGRGGGRPERVQGAGDRVEGLAQALRDAWEALPEG